jgi:hypothetical protein
MRLAVVLGSSAGALDEFAAAQAFLASNNLETHTIAVNAAVRFCPVKPVAFASVFSLVDGIERFLTGVDLDGVQLFSRRADPRLAFKVVKPKWHGSSGLYAVQIALEEMGFDGAILAGCPMDAAGGTLCAHSEMSEAAKVDRFKPQWLRALPHIGARTRSMSGWTQKILGAPDAEWLAGLTPPAAAARS